MPTSRTYGDACGIARALDVVGERWALLVVRELLLGPQRFSDLRRVLPGASSNLVTDRLRELEEHGVVCRRRLPPPARSSAYDLTEWGRELEPVVLALGGWGLQVPLPSTPTTLSATSVLLYLRGAARPVSRDAQTVLRLDLDDRVGIVDVFVNKPGAKRILASKEGYGFILPEEEAIAFRRAGKQVLNPGPKGALILVRSAVRAPQTATKEAR